MEDKLVSVLLFVEDVDDDLIKAAVDNVKEQTHNNIDLIISSFKEENSEEIKNYTSERFLNARWFNSPASPQFINETLSKADGEYVFYKTINNVAWFPRHIELEDGVSLLHYPLNASRLLWSLKLVRLTAYR